MSTNSSDWTVGDYSTRRAMGGRTRTSGGQSSDKRDLHPGVSHGEKIPTPSPPEVRKSTMPWQEGRGISIRGNRLRSVPVWVALEHSRDWPEWLGWAGVPACWKSESLGLVL